MSDFDPTNMDGYQQDDDDDNQPKESPKGLRDARDRAAESAKAEKDRADKAEKKLAFLEAEVDLNSAVGQLLFDSYVGELTTEAIRTRAEELGALKKAEAPSGETPPADENDQNQTKERNDLAGDSQPPGTTPDADPRIEGLQAARNSMSQGTDRTDAAAQFLNRVVDAAAKGDERVIYNKDRDRGQAVV